MLCSLDCAHFNPLTAADCSRLHFRRGASQTSLIIAVIATELRNALSLTDF